MQARLTTKALPDVISAIQALDLESVKLRVMDAELGEGWTREYADSIEGAYRNYLMMLVKYPDDAEDIMLSEDVDEFWHTHILQTRKYHEDCHAVFGNYLHHEPHVGEITPADLEKRERLAEKTRGLYEQEFGGAKRAGTAWSGGAIRGDRAAYSGASIRMQGAAYSGASIREKSAAYSGASISAGTAAYSGASLKAERAAYSGASIQSQGAAYSGASIKAKGAAYSGASIEAGKAAYSGASIRTRDAAYSGASINEKSAAYSGASINPKLAAYSGASIDSRNSAYSGASIQSPSAAKAQPAVA